MMRILVCSMIFFLLYPNNIHSMQIYIKYSNMLALLGSNLPLLFCVTMATKSIVIIIHKQNYDSDFAIYFL